MLAPAAGAPRGNRDWETRLVEFIDVRFEQLRGRYHRLLERSLRYTPVTAVFVVVILAAIFLLYRSARSELAPQEDEGSVITQAIYAPDATLQRKLMYSEQAYPIFKNQPGADAVFQIVAPGQAVAGVTLVPRNQRKLGANEIQRDLQGKLNSLPAQRFAVFQLPPLPGASGLPVQFAIKTTDPALRLNEVSQAFLDTVTKSGMFMFIDSDLKYDAPQSVIEIDRDKAAQLGLTMNQIGSALGSLLGGGYVNYSASRRAPTR